MSVHTDALLLRRFREGDQAGFDELFQRHYSMVYGVLYRLVGTRAEAEDMAQEVFVRLYRNPLRRDENVAGWLYRVAVNTGYNALRAAYRRERREQAAGLGSQPSPGPEDEVQQREVAGRVRAALMRIPERDARLLVLSDAGFDYRELAEIVQVAPGSIGTLLARARKAFAAEYGIDE